MVVWSNALLRLIDILQYFLSWPELGLMSTVMVSFEQILPCETLSTEAGIWSFFGICLHNQASVLEVSFSVFIITDVRRATTSHGASVVKV